jgi:hypothetical protein
MKGWKKTTVRGKSPARKKQRASGDHSVSKVRQKKGPAAKSSSLGFAGNKIQWSRDNYRDNIGGKIKAPREGCGD